MAGNDLTAERLWRMLDYDDKTGLFTWRVSPGGPSKLGTPVGSVSSDGYLKIMLDGRTHSAHRLAFLYMTGFWPAGEVDHRDGDRLNNRWSNLRDVAHQTNAQNRRTSGNAVGLLGVSKHHRSERYRATLRVNGRNMRLGWFATPEEAHQVYVNAKRKFHEGNTL